MTKSIIRQARSLLEGEADGASDLINQVQATREDAERKRLQAQKMLDEAEEMRTQALQRLEQLKHERKMLTDQTDREIDKSMHQVRQLADGLIAQMQNAPKPWSGHVNEFSRQIIAAAASTPLAVRQAKFAESVRKGDAVYVAPFRRNGIVYRINRKRGIFTLLVEGKLVQVPLTDIWEPKNP